MVTFVFDFEIPKNLTAKVDFFCYFRNLVKNVRRHIQKHIEAFLKEQYHYRVDHHRFEYPLSAVPVQYRASNGTSLKMGSNDPSKSDIDNLTELAELMIKHDRRVQQEPKEGARGSVKVMRELPVISPAHTDPTSLRLKKELHDKRVAAATPVDGPLYVELANKYLGLLFFDYETDKRTYRIDAISYIENEKSTNPPAWVATSVEVFRGADGKWAPASKNMVVDSHGGVEVKRKAYEEYALVELPELEDPLRRPWVDQYVAKHEELLQSTPNYGEEGWRQPKHKAGPIKRARKERKS